MKFEMSLVLNKLRGLVLRPLHCLGSYPLLLDGLIIIRGLILHFFLNDSLTSWALHVV